MSGSPAFALRTAAWLLALALVALPLVGVMQGWFAVGRWPLRQLRIDGPFHHVSAAQVRAAVRPHVAPGFFAVPLDQVRDAVERLPWVAVVDVRKRWPDVLEIRLRERSPAAIWQGGELVDVEGRLFAVPPGSAPDGLPRFAGPRTRVREVLDFYNETKPQLAPFEMRIAAVQMSRRGGWSIRLADGIEIVLGSEDARARLSRFLAVQGPLAAAASARMLRADLRYANGFAVAWQPLPSVDPTPTPIPIPTPTPIVPSPEARPDSSPVPFVPSARESGVIGLLCARSRCAGHGGIGSDQVASLITHPALRATSSLREQGSKEIPRA